jgi:hypothetical protein
VYGWWGLLYAFFALLPVVIQFFGFYPSLIVQMSLVASCGLFREKKLITEVIRMQKLAKLMRLLIMMTKLKTNKKGKGDVERPDKKPSYDVNDPKVKAEIAEITKIFQMYDEDGSGECTYK